MTSSWDLSTVLNMALKSTEKCPAYLQFTSKKGEHYGRAARKICMFPQTWDVLKNLKPVLVEALEGSGTATDSWKLYPNWEVEVREFKGAEYVCFSQWEGQTRIPKFNLSRDEYQTLLQVSNDINAVIKEMQSETRVPQMQKTICKEGS
jgi:hypothetical protein